MYVYLPHIQLGVLSLSTYHAVVLAAFCISTALALRFNAQAKESLNLDILVLPVILTSALIGARLTYILLEPQSEPWWYALRFWDGGYYYHGGLFGGIAGFIAYTRFYGNKLLPSLDRAVPFVVLGESIARLGCLLSGCCIGRPTPYPFGVYYPRDVLPFHLPINIDSSGSFWTAMLHPVQIYATCLLLLLYLYLLWIARQSRLYGETFLHFLILHSMLRAGLDNFRADLTPSLLNNTLTQWISILIVTVAIALLLFLYTASRKEPLFTRQTSEEVN